MKKVDVFFLVFVVLSWTCILAGPFSVFGQEESSQIKVEVPLQKVPVEEGQVLIVIFKDGLPAKNIVVRTPKGVLTTDSSGVLSLSLPAQKQKIEIVSTEQEVEFSVVPKEEVQVTVHLLEDQESQAEVKSPSGLEIKAATQGPKKDLKIKVLSKQQVGISDATILFSGLDQVYKTDATGVLNAQIPEGQYAFSVFHPNYQTQTLTNLTVDDAAEPITVELKAAQNELEEVIVLAPKIKGSLSALVEVRKQSSAVTDVLGAEQMARAGDSDAAASLRRVTGLTLVGGKYVYVRGLGERYSGVQMNGFSLPSPEPARRVVPLDLFPTAIMESIVVQKSYSPDLPGEFGGGIIQLQTRSIPEKFFFRGNVSFVYENISNRLEHKGGETDWLGFDDGSRQMPDIIKNALAQGKQLEINNDIVNNGVSKKELMQMSMSLPDYGNFSRTDSPSMPGLSLSMGNGWKFGRFKLGTTGSMMYGQSTDQLQRTVTTFNINTNKFVADSRRESEYSEIETRVAGNYDVGLEINQKHKLIASTFLLRNTTKLTQVDQTTAEGVSPIQSLTFDFTERQLWTRHFKGEHELMKVTGAPLKLDWRVGWSDALRDSPGRSELAYNMIGNTKSILDGQTGNRRIYSELEDNSTERALNLSIPIQKSGDDFIKIKLGYLQIDKDRQSDINRLSLIGQNLSEVDKENADKAYSDQNIKDEKAILKSSSTNTDSYRGVQTIQAQYVMMDISPFESLSLHAGVRRETSEQIVNTFRYMNPANSSSTSNIQMTDLLPSYGLTWKPTDAVRARLTYSETLSRPDFREMSIVSFIDDETGYTISGNEALKGTVIKNIDHRWEYYFTSDEYASIGFFYKEFENPIEIVFLSGVNPIQTFENAKAAQNYGVELEGRVGLRHFSRPLRRWTVLSNVSFINSEIELGSQSKGEQTSKSRPLQGQSPYVLNFQLQYDRPKWGLSTTLLYNVIGKRITEVGTNRTPDTYEQPFEQLDFVATQRLADNWTLSLRARNLLNPQIESTQGDDVVRSQKRGRVYGLVLGAVF